MKIDDWNTLKEQGFAKVKDKYKKGGNIYYRYEHCKECGKPFLGKKDSIYCSMKCSSKKKYSKESRKKISESQKGKKLSEETKRKMSEKAKLRTGEKNSFYGKKHTDETKKRISKTKLDKSSGCYSKGVAAFDTYAHQLELIEEIRRNKQDTNVLEVKCSKCGEWFVPKLWIVRNRVQYFKNVFGVESRFYCSNKCKNSCSIYHKSTDQIERQDAIRAGRLPWLELTREVQPELRQMVLERDNNECVKCGETENVQCHHILPVAIEPLLSADIDNCITLCINCHKEAHMKDGCRYNQLKTEEC